MPWVEFLKWIWRGKSARRTLLNMEAAKRVALEGVILDVGGKGKPSYREVLQSSEKIAWVVMDISLGEHVSIGGNLTAMPFKDEVFDTVLCFNVLEHVYDYRGALSEMWRVLKANGVLYGYVPFICNVHPNPSDYWRFTGDCLNECLSEAGYALESITPHGGVFLSCFDLTEFVVKKVPPLRVLLATLFLFADFVVSRFRLSFARQFPVGYFFIGRKSSVV